MNNIKCVNLMIIYLYELTATEKFKVVFLRLVFNEIIFQNLSDQRTSRVKL